MTTEQMERANKIQHRLKELNVMKAWIEKFDGVYIVASGKGISDIIPLSENMRNVIHGMCLGEIAEFEKEFDEL